jgi:hypothetical protein
MDSFAEPVIGRCFAPTRWLAMTALTLLLTHHHPLRLDDFERAREFVHHRHQLGEPHCIAVNVILATTASGSEVCFAITSSSIARGSVKLASAAAASAPSASGAS